MTIEEKAKAYDEALERAREYHNVDIDNTMDVKARGILEYLFPELAGSEDERIRKGLINYFNHHKNGINIFYGIKGDDILAWLEKQGEPQDKGEISDGYHTFNELYYYRMLYNAAFFNMLPKEWVYKSKRHNDGEECFGGGWFIVMANLPTGQISNHYELKDWDLFQIPEKEVADKWDGHTPQKAADRLHKYLLEKQDEQKPFDYENANIQQKDWAEIPFGTKDSELQEATYIIPEGFHAEIRGNEVFIKKGEQKPAWSVEDTFKVQRICKYLDEAKKYYADITEVRDCIEWLKSLKQRIGG